MDLLENISSMFGTNLNTRGAQGTPVPDLNGAEGLQKLLAPAALGGLAALLFGGKGIGSAIKGALLGGGGAYLWNQYKDKFREKNVDNPQFQGGSMSPPAERTERVIRALIYAAKADGHIDDDERARINAHIQGMNAGDAAARIVNAAMNEPLDPALVAQGVMDEEEALQLFTLSCACSNVDNALEKNYLDALAEALHIPREVRDDIAAKITQAGKQQG